MLMLIALCICNKTTKIKTEINTNTEIQYIQNKTLTKYKTHTTQHLISLRIKKRKIKKKSKE